MLLFLQLWVQLIFTEPFCTLLIQSFFSSIKELNRVSMPIWSKHKQKHVVHQAFFFHNTACALERFSLQYYNAFQSFFFPRLRNSTESHCQLEANTSKNQGFFFHKTACALERFSVLFFFGSIEQLFQKKSTSHFVESKTRGGANPPPPFLNIF